MLHFCSSGWGVHKSRGKSTQADNTSASCRPSFTFTLFALTDHLPSFTRAVLTILRTSAFCFCFFLSISCEQGIAIITHKKTQLWCQKWFEKLDAEFSEERTSNFQAEQRGASNEWVRLVRGYLRYHPAPQTPDITDRNANVSFWWKRLHPSSPNNHSSRETPKEPQHAQLFRKETGNVFVKASWERNSCRKKRNCFQRHRHLPCGDRHPRSLWKKSASRHGEPNYYYYDVSSLSISGTHC